MEIHTKLSSFEAAYLQSIRCLWDSVVKSDYSVESVFRVKSYDEFLVSLANNNKRLIKSFVSEVSES